MLTRNPVEGHPEVFVRTVGVLGPGQQVKGLLVLEDEVSEFPCEGHIGSAKVNGHVVRGGRFQFFCFKHVGIFCV